MSFIDTLLGKLPEPYDPDDDALAKVDPVEVRSAGFAARRNAERYIVSMRALNQAAIELHGTRRLLVIIIVLLIANKVIDFSVLAGAFAP